MSMTPETREELYLAAIAGEGTAPAPLTRKEQYLKKIAEGPRGGGGGDVSWDEIKDRPFGETVSREVFIEPTTDSWFDLMMIGQPPFDAVFVVDGVEYACQRTSYEDGSFVPHDGYGDHSFNKYPFWAEIEGEALEIFYKDGGTHTVAIYEEIVETKTLDSKYLPEISVSWDNVTDKPFYKSETVKAEFDNAAFTNQDDIYCEFDISNVEVTDGDTLIFDDESYELETVASGYSMGGSGNVWIMGNPAIVSILYDNSDWDIFESFDDNGLPFAIVIKERNGETIRTIYSEPSATGDNHSFKIFNSAIKTLDPVLGGVPASTAEDEGKVLTVENGEAKWATPAKASAVADVTAAPTADEFNALLASLRAAGYLAE